MSYLLSRLYDALGLAEPGDEPLIKVDDELTIYFNESESGLEMCCPFATLTDDVNLLHYYLRINYAGPIVIGVDEDNTALLALHRLLPASTDDELLAGLELLIQSVNQLMKQEVTGHL